MAHRHLIEAFDIGLCDITKMDMPFGGKTIVKQGSRAHIINATITIPAMEKPNHRGTPLLGQLANCLHGFNPEAEHYAQWLLTVGDDDTAATTSNGIYNDLITFPDHILFHGSNDNLANWVFPNLDSYNQLDSGDWLCQRAVLTPNNEHVNNINKNPMMDLFPGDGSDEMVTQSADILTQEFENAGIPNEYLSSLNPSGFPPHRLRLKIGLPPLILLRNLNPSQGLLNGTKPRLQRIHDHMVVLEVKISGGDHNDNIVCLPRILLKPKTEIIHLNG